VQARELGPLILGHPVLEVEGAVPAGEHVLGRDPEAGLENDHGGGRPYGDRAGVRRELKRHFISPLYGVHSGADSYLLSGSDNRKELLVDKALITLEDSTSVRKRATRENPSAAIRGHPSRLFQAVWDGVLLLLVAIFMYVAFVRSVDLNWGPRSKECLMIGGRLPFVRFHMGEECFVGGPGE
jgi:hypothetical protein